MTMIFVSPSTSAISLSVSVYVMEMISEFTTLVSSAVYGRVDAFIVEEAALTTDNVTILAGPYNDLGNAEIPAMDVGTDSKAISHNIPDWAAVSIVCGLFLALIAFVALWLTNSKTPAVVMPIGLALAAIGFWRAERAMRTKE